MIASRAGRHLVRARDTPRRTPFRGPSFARSPRHCSAGRTASVLQYGPTRGYRPLLEEIAAIIERPRDSRAPSRSCSSRPARSRDSISSRACCSIPATWCSSSCQPTPARSRRFETSRPRWSACRRRRTASSFDALEATYQRLRLDGRRVKALYVVPNFQNPTGLLIGLEKRRRLLAWAADRDVLIIEDDPYHDLYFEDSATPAEVRSIKADDADGARRVPEQLLQDAGARLPRRLDCRASRHRAEARNRQAVGGPADRIARPADRPRSVSLGTARAATAEAAAALSRRSGT